MFLLEVAMIPLDQKYQSYLDGSKTMMIDGKKEKVKGYGYSCDGNKIIGYYVTTESYKVHYNLKEEFQRLEMIRKMDCLLYTSDAADE